MPDLSLVKEIQNQDAEACHAIFTNILKLHTVYGDIGAIRSDGQVFASAVPDRSPTNVGGQSFFRNATSRLMYSFMPCCMTMASVSAAFANSIL